MAKKPVAPEPEAIETEAAPVEEMDLGAVEDQASTLVDTMIEEAPADAIETPTLSAEEIADIEARARREVDAEFKKALKAEVLADAKERERKKRSMHVNKHLNGVLSDMVRITINIPEFSNTPWIHTDLPHGKVYIHGESYTVPRHVGNSLRETMQHMRRHQNEIDGKRRNRQLPDGSFVDAVSGHKSAGRTVSGQAEAA